MDTVPYTIRMQGDTVTVDAFHPVPGLYVYLTPEQWQNPNHPYHWTIGHQSGYSIAAFERSVDALDAAEGLADFTNWQRSADELRTDVDPYDLRDLIEDRGGAFLSRQPVAA